MSASPPMRTRLARALVRLLDTMSAVSGLSKDPG